MLRTFVLASLVLISYSLELPNFVEVHKDFLNTLPKVQTKANRQIFDSPPIPGVNWTVPRVNLDKDVIDNYVQSIVNCRPDYIGAITVAAIQLDTDDNIQLSYTNAFGKLNQSDPDSGSPDTHSRFCVGSITKFITAQVVGEVLASKNLTYDVLLKDIIPDFYQFYFGDPAAEKMTIRDILTHRHAIPSHDAPILFAMKKTREECWRNLKYLAPQANFSIYWRNVFQYSNWMYSLAGYAASLVYDRSGNTTWEQLVQKFIFDPLQMDSATFLHADHKWHNFSITSNKNVNKPGWNPFNLNYGQQFSDKIAPAGSMCVSANDMVKYLQHLARISESAEGAPTRTTVHQSFMASNNHLFTDPTDFTYIDPLDVIEDFSYGLGMGTGMYKGTRKLSHGGLIMGYISNLMILPDFKTGIFVSTTNDPYYNMGVAEQLTLGIWDILSNTSIAKPNSPDTLCGMSLPPLTTTIVDFVLKCEIDYTPEYAAILGSFKHPTFDDITVSYQAESRRIRWYFGEQGTATLCSPTLIQPNQLLFAIKIDTNSTMSIFRYDQLLAVDPPVLVFVFESPVKDPLLVMSFFEPRANPPPIFTKYIPGTNSTTSSYDTTTFITTIKVDTTSVRFTTTDFQSTFANGTTPQLDITTQSATTVIQNTSTTTSVDSTTSDKQSTTTSSSTVLPITTAHNTPGTTVIQDTSTSVDSTTTDNQTTTASLTTVLPTSTAHNTPGTTVIQDTSTSVDSTTTDNQTTTASLTTVLPTSTVHNTPETTVIQDTSTSVDSTTPDKQSTTTSEYTVLPTGTVQNTTSPTTDNLSTPVSAVQSTSANPSSTTNPNRPTDSNSTSSATSTDSNSTENLPSSIPQSTTTSSGFTSVADPHIFIIILILILM